jgi:hypothetical protein
LNPLNSYWQRQRQRQDQGIEIYRSEFLKPLRGINLDKMEHVVNKTRKKMEYQVVNLCEDSDGFDNAELLNTNAASVSLLLLSRKRPRNKEESSSKHAHHPRNKNDPRNTAAAGSADFVVDLELADEVEVPVSAHKRRKRRTVVKNDAVGKYAQIPKGVHATERDVSISEDAQVADHRESHQSIITAAAATASHPMNSYSEQPSRSDGSANKHSQKASTSEPPSIAAGRQGRYSAWEDRLSELADYRKIHGHCNVPRKYSKNTKLAQWATNQRSHYRLHLDGHTSPMTSFRIEALESLDFEWGVYHGVTWEDRFTELADYRKSHGHCNVPQGCSETAKLSIWVKTQRKQYRLHLEGKTSYMTTFRIQELESLGFESGVYATTVWEERLRELADYRRIHGHCNVPRSNGENAKLANWVGTQRTEYRLLYEEGKTSSMTLSNIQALESLGFEWNTHGASWEIRLSELADYRKEHGHCNVPRSYSENTRLSTWVRHQRTQNRLHRDGKPSLMTLTRIQELEDIGFEWGTCGTAWEDRLSELAGYRKIQGHCNVPTNYSENTKLAHWVANQRKQYKLHAEGKASSMTLPRIQELERLGFRWMSSTAGRRKGEQKKPSVDDDTNSKRFQM